MKKRSLELALLIVLIALGAALWQRPRDSAWHRGNWRLGSNMISPSKPQPHIFHRVECPDVGIVQALGGHCVRVHKLFGIISFDADYLDGPRGHLEVGKFGQTLFARLGRESYQIHDAFFWETSHEVIRATLFRGKVQQLTLMKPFLCPDQKLHNCDFKDGWWRNHL